MIDFARMRGLLQARRPNHALPAPFYTDAEVFEFDLRAIFHRSWLMVGFEVELAEPGAVLSLTIARAPIIVVRGRDGVLRGFHNSCRHRGAQICPPGKSSAALLVCPYHQWSYDLTGALRQATRMGDDFDPAAHGLRPIHVASAGGAVHVCLAEQAPAFDAFSDGLAPLLAQHGVTRAKLAGEATLIEKANWKLVMENARECYHCAARHPALAASFPTTARAHFAADAGGRADRFKARMAEAGVLTGPVEGDWWQAVRFPLNDGCRSMTADGAPVVAKPMCERAGGDVGSLRWAVEPHSFCHALGDYLFMFAAYPIGVEETLVVSKWLVRADAVEGVDYDLAALKSLWIETNLQDLELVENNQRGVHSPGYVPGPYSPESEQLARRFVDWYCTTASDYVAAHG